MRNLLNKKESLLLLGGIVFCLFSGFLVYKNLDLRRQIKNKDSQILSKEKELSDKEEEVLQCIGNKAQLIKEYTTPYSFSEFGIYSPYFTGKNIRVVDYLYKRSFIKRMSLEIPGEDFGGESAIVEVWEYERTSPVYMKLGLPVPRVEIVENNVFSIESKGWTTYNNPHGIIMAKSYGVFTFSLENTPNGKPIFVKISSGWGEGVVWELREIQLRESTQPLIPLVNSISYKKY